MACVILPKKPKHPEGTIPLCDAVLESEIILPFTSSNSSVMK